MPRKPEKNRTARLLHLDEMIEQILDEVQPYSMVHPANLTMTIQCALQAIESNLPGDFVECGVWRGGASFAMLLAQRYRYGRILRPVWLFDSFEGLPEVDERDGPLAAAYQRDKDAPHYMDNCRASYDDVMMSISQFGFSSTEAIVVPGWFSDTIPEKQPSLAKCGISFLRVDCDWYEPVAQVLQDLTPLVPNEGSILVDDYYAWDGCARATHDFLSRNKYSWRIRSLPELTGAIIIKRPFRNGAL